MRISPELAELEIDEVLPSAPGGERLARECRAYQSTYCYPGVERGALHNGSRNEDLEALTFPDDRFDVVITQDVFEHVFDYRMAFREVMRTVRPGGHMSSRPRIKGLAASQDRAGTQKWRDRPSLRARIPWQPD